jgi:hypothetical protein
LVAGFRNFIRHEHICEVHNLQLKLASANADRRKGLGLDFRRGTVTVSQRTARATV